MARELGDVLHYFLDERPGDPEMSAARAPPNSAPPMIAVPLGASDVVRAAFVWNLAVEIARTPAPGLREVFDPRGVLCPGRGV